MDNCYIRLYCLLQTYSSLNGKNTSSKVSNIIQDCSIVVWLEKLREAFDMHSYFVFLVALMVRRCQATLPDLVQGMGWSRIIVKDLHGAAILFVCACAESSDLVVELNNIINAPTPTSPPLPPIPRLSSSISPGGGGGQEGELSI